MKTIINLLFLMVSFTINSQVLGIYSTEAYDTNISKTKKEIKTLDMSSIKLDISVLVDNKMYNDSTYTITVSNITQNIMKTHKNMPHKFILYLAYANEYIIDVSHKGVVTKKIYVNTNRAPITEDWYIYATIQLKRGIDKPIYAGSIKYIDSLQTFKAIALR